MDTCPLVETDWLHDHLGDAGIRLAHIHYAVRFQGDRAVIPDEEEAFYDGHLPGAVFLGAKSGLTAEHPGGWNDVPAPEAFAANLGRLGIGNDTLVVAYDDAAVSIGAARLWWLLRYYGHERVVVLNGGLRKWRAEGRPVTDDSPSYPTRDFVCGRRPQLRADKEEVAAALGDPRILIIDCMPRELWDGSAHRAWGVRRGRIPGSANVPWLATAWGDPRALTDEGRKTALADANAYYPYRSPEELRRLYAGAGVASGRRVITYCEGGFAACNAALTLSVAGFEAAVFDGSWAEWSRDAALPVQTG